VNSTESLLPRVSVIFGEQEQRRKIRRTVPAYRLLTLRSCVQLIPVQTTRRSAISQHGLISQILRLFFCRAGNISTSFLSLLVSRASDTASSTRPLDHLCAVKLIPWFFISLKAIIPLLHVIPWLEKADGCLFPLTARHNKTLGLDGSEDLRLRIPHFPSHIQFLPQYTSFA
jgi:hypothetical protein